MWAALMSPLPVLCVKTGSSCVSVHGNRMSLNQIISRFCVISSCHSIPQIWTRISQLDHPQQGRRGSITLRCECVTVHVCCCCIYMCLIIIYTLDDSQYKSFYEHLYQSDGRLCTLALFRSDCYISVTVLPSLRTLSDKYIDCIAPHCH